MGKHWQERLGIQRCWPNAQRLLWLPGTETWLWLMRVRPSRSALTGLRHTTGAAPFCSSSAGLVAQPRDPVIGTVKAPLSQDRCYVLIIPPAVIGYMREAKPLMHRRLGRALAALYQWRDAANAFAAALRLEPGNAEVPSLTCT